MGHDENMALIMIMAHDTRKRRVAAGILGDEKWTALGVEKGEDLDEGGDSHGDEFLHMTSQVFFGEKRCSESVVWRRRQQKQSRIRDVQVEGGCWRT